MHKITNGERNRVVAILDDSIERLMLLSYVPERAHEAVLAELEPGPYEVFLRHWELEGASRVDKVELEESARRICRCLRDSPRTFAVLQRYGNDRKESKEFCQALLDLKELVGRRLGETVQHAKQREDHVAHANLKMRQAAETKALVEAERDRALQRFEQDSATASKICAMLSSGIDEHNRANAAEKSLRDAESLAKIQELNLQHEEVCKAQALVISEREAKLADEMQAQADEALLWRRRKNKVEAELRSTIEKYDVNMLAIQAQVDELQTKYDVEMKEYAELADYYSVIDQDLAIEAEEERLIKEKSAVADEQRAKLERGVAKIQALFRGRRARAGGGKKGKGGKKKGGKKKGKGKKKK